MFNYVDATLEQMVEHVKESSIAAITKMKAYYRNKGNEEVVKKIDLARECVKLEKVQQRMSDLKND